MISTFGTSSNIEWFSIFLSLTRTVLSLAAILNFANTAASLRARPTEESGIWEARMVPR